MDGSDLSTRAGSFGGEDYIKEGMIANPGFHDELKNAVIKVYVQGAKERTMDWWNKKVSIKKYISANIYIGLIITEIYLFFCIFSAIM